MIKKYVVRLTDEERGVCQAIVKKLKGSSEKVRRAQVLLKADADGPGWPDAQIAEAFDCRVQTIEKIRQRLVPAKPTASGRVTRRASSDPACLLRRTTLGTHSDDDSVTSQC